MYARAPGPPSPVVDVIVRTMITYLAMSEEKQPDVQQQPAPSDTTTNPSKPKKKLTLDIDEVDVSEVLERKISA